MNFNSINDFGNLRSIDDIDAIKSDSKKILYSKGNLTKLVLLCILTTFAIMIPVLIYFYFSALFITLFDEEGQRLILSYILPALLSLIGAVFVSFPAISGTYLCGRKIYCGEKHTFIEGYTDRYRKNIAFGAILILRWIPAIAMLILSFILPPMITESIMTALESSLNEFVANTETLSLFVDIKWLVSTFISSAISMAFLLTALLITVAVIALSGRMFLFPYFISKGHGIKDALKSSRDIMRDPQKKRNHRKFLSSFIGFLCLSLLTLGLLLIFYVVPLMLTEYNMLAEKMTDN